MIISGIGAADQSGALSQVREFINHGEVAPEQGAGEQGANNQGHLQDVFGKNVVDEFF